MIIQFSEGKLIDWLIDYNYDYDCDNTRKRQW